MEGGREELVVPLVTTRVTRKRGVGRENAREKGWDEDHGR